MKRIVVFGICGNTGSAITRELLKETSIEVVGGFDKKNPGEDIGILLGIGPVGKNVYTNYDDVLALRPGLLIDFTSAEIAGNTIRWAQKNNIDIIVGTTGFSKEEIQIFSNDAETASSKVFLVPNFSIGAVIMMKLASLISPYFENCEIIELHHDKKKDAPSGTSIQTAEKIAEINIFNEKRLKDSEKENLQGSRGSFYEGIHIHSIRLPGLIAHQQVLFGALGQTLSLRHDTTDRTAFYPGVLMAIKKIDSLSNFTYGLDKILEL